MILAGSVAAADACAPLARGGRLSRVCVMAGAQGSGSRDRV
ncbi:hypothetical protein [Lysobacter gummosus]